jgi:hypothetical protein
MRARDWNAGGPGLPFYLPSAVSAQPIEADAAGLVAPIGTRKHGRLVELVAAYRADGHEPEIWHGRQVVSTGEGTARVPFLLVRCRRCDRRTLVRRLLRAGARYAAGACEPITVEELEEREQRGRQRAAVLHLRMLAGVAALLGLAAVAAAVERGLRPVHVVAMVSALLVATAFLVGARERGRPLPRGGRPRPWWTTAWGRAGAVLVASAVVALVIVPGVPDVHLRVDPAGDPEHPAARGCAIVAAGSTLEVLGVSVPATALGGPTGSGAGRFLPDDEGTFGCWGARGTRGAVVVSLTCVGAGFRLRQELDAGDGGIVVNDGPPPPPGTQSATWTASTGGRGLLVERDGFLVQIGAWGGESGGSVDEGAFLQAVALLDYATAATHVGCVTG